MVESLKNTKTNVQEVVVIANDPENAAAARWAFT
jgi:hypothetical protein